MREFAANIIQITISSYHYAVQCSFKFREIFHDVLYINRDFQLARHSKPRLYIVNILNGNANIRRGSLSRFPKSVKSASLTVPNL